MMLNDLLKYARPPADDKSGWLSSAVDSVDFLKKVYRGNRVILYASVDAFYVHAVLVDAAKVSPADHDDMLRAYLDASSGWRLEHESGGGQPDRMYLAGPMSSPGCKTLVDAEQLVFRRRLDGVQSARAYTEISQKLTQALDLHFVEERRAYCRVDKAGNIESVITVEDFPALRDRFPGHLVTMSAEPLMEFMAVTGTVLAAKFDFTRTDGSNFPGWEGAVRDEFRAPDLFYRTGSVPGMCSFVNGWLLVRPRLTVNELIAEKKAADDPAKRQYAEFKILDIRYGEQRTNSCSPLATTNYFELAEGMPFELSPAFFRAEVLSKYKANPEKYQLEARSISCRNVWELRSYDINDAGQVHTYLIDLSHLPYEEQLYWQSFNEWPKGSISRRSYESDFKGEWTTAVDHLDEVKRIVAKLDTEGHAWWSPRGEALPLTVHYPSLENSAEWGDEILHLDQLVVEGFRASDLKVLAAKLKAAIDPSWASLKIIEACLVAGGSSAEQARDILAPLKTLHGLRSTLTAHSGGQAKRDAERATISDHKTYRGHYEDLVERCHDSLEVIVEFLEGHATSC
jgi:hypothetical protein